MRVLLLDSLTPALLRSRADRLGFRNTGNLEKFVADFDAHEAISRSLTCHVRGGLCFPFHVDSSAHRLSTDLDLYTEDEKDDVVATVPGLLEGHGFTSVSTHWLNRNDIAPSHPVRFKARFKSSFGKTSSIFVDVACKFDMGLVDTMTVPPGHDLMGMRTEHEISALSMGSLLADKIISLAIGTIGYNRLLSTQKQIYDVGKLIQHAGADDLESMMSTYGRLTDFKLSRDSRGYTSKEATASIVSYLGKVGRADPGPDFPEHWVDFKNFSTSMLSRGHWAQTDQEERILLVLACAQSLARLLGHGASPAAEAAALRAAVDGANTRRASGAHLDFLREALGLPAA